MATWTLWQNGTCFGTAPVFPIDKKREIEKRRECIGWTPSSTRNLTKWLYGADVQGFGAGFAFTLTVKDLPYDAKAWAATRKRFIMRLKRLGITHLHWLTEWQLRKMPHLHGCLWFAPGASIPPNVMGLIKTAWLESAKEYNPLEFCQDVKPMHSYLGWKKYLSKHASRSAHNSQRCSSNMPDTWKTSGRMWGYWGDWDMKKAKITMCEKAGHSLRRIIKNWRIASARKEKNTLAREKRLKSAKRLFQTNNIKLSRVRGFSEWLDYEDQLKIARHLIDRGFLLQFEDASQ